MSVQAYLGPYQHLWWRFLARIVIDEKASTVLEKSSIIDVWQGPKYASARKIPRKWVKNIRVMFNVAFWNLIGVRLGGNRSSARYWSGVFLVNFTGICLSVHLNKDHSSYNFCEVFVKSRFFQLSNCFHVSRKQIRKHFKYLCSMPQLTVKNAAKMQTKNLFRFFCNPSKNVSVTCVRVSWHFLKHCE